MPYVSEEQLATPRIPTSVTELSFNSSPCDNDNVATEMCTCNGRQASSSLHTQARENVHMESYGRTNE